MAVKAKAIETEYRGYRFRSRVEARYAVFFDALGIRWDYEPEGWELPSGRYLPDFWLPQVSMWAEVKAGIFSVGELAKCVELATATGKPVLMLDGTPDAKTYPAVNSPTWDDDRPGELGKIHPGYVCRVDYFDLHHNHRYHLTESRFFQSECCDFPYPECNEYAPKIIFGGNYVSRTCPETDPDDCEGVIAARSARFEFGEKGGRR